MDAKKTVGCSAVGCSVKDARYSIAGAGPRLCAKHAAAMRPKTLAALVAFINTDPRATSVNDEGKDGWWIALADGFTFEGCTQIHIERDDGLDGKSDEDMVYEALLDLESVAALSKAVSR